MFEHPLPTTFKPLKLARQQGKLKGYLSLDQMPALVADCVDGLGRVEADLQLDMEGRWPVLTGSAQTRLSMTCQRCLETVEVPIEIRISLGFSQSEEYLAELPAHLEPFLLEEEEIPLAMLLEQELILALPIVPYHSECEPAPYQKGEIAADAAEEKPNPFKVLEQLKGQLKKTD